MSRLGAVRAALGKAVAYLREVTGEAAFERHCRTHAATGSAARRALWREHTRRTARETARCC
ncbi:hypothetical protein [Streptomyces rubradiris]|uniref:Uncharacterized protein n=1 Tax=Streptomyces rubradiris TaxID=285531 RepID=A0ABQ3REZ7_STRRR|nr:hypothetical protein [Streptomyces rubradiris]GHG97570.1 hypothetical protein GCM10018792_09520 [Streptomyces rubradiris]GHI54430.1 hypothetical protein Srubr_42760 [Streptomyces rubradiris]